MPGRVRNARSEPVKRQEMNLPEQKRRRSPDDMNPLFVDHMLADPVLQAEITARCQETQSGDDPVCCADDLGLLRLPDGNEIKAWLVHAADSVVLDERDQVLLITRLNHPGRGKLALPGGLLDETPTGMESSLQAALREAAEETGISSAQLAQARITKLGARRKCRPFDIRRAWNNLPGTPIRQGEIFTVSTLGFLVRLSGNLMDMALQAGDDASALHILPAHEVRLEDLAVPDHFELIHAALAVNNGQP